jgi:hypothetical protein
MEEMSGRGVANSEDLRDRLIACFANVTPGDRITGVRTGANTAMFYFNGQRRCSIEHSGFSRAFFGIWLDGSGANRRFRDQLLGSG